MASNLHSLEFLQLPPVSSFCLKQGSKKAKPVGSVGQMAFLLFFLDILTLHSVQK
jgi:hypothetical protein